MFSKIAAACVLVFAIVFLQGCADKSEWHTKQFFPQPEMPTYGCDSTVADKCFADYSTCDALSACISAAFCCDYEKEGKNATFVLESACNAGGTNACVSGVGVVITGSFVISVPDANALFVDSSVGDAIEDAIAAFAGVESSWIELEGEILRRRLSQVFRRLADSIKVSYTINIPAASAAAGVAAAAEATLTSATPTQLSTPIVAEVQKVKGTDFQITVTSVEKPSVAVATTTTTTTTTTGASMVCTNSMPYGWSYDNCPTLYCGVMSDETKRYMCEESVSDYLMCFQPGIMIGGDKFKEFCSKSCGLCQVEACQCNGHADPHDGSGGPNCADTHNEGVPWCYVNPGACPDGVLSYGQYTPDGALQQWSEIACQGVVSMIGSPSTQVFTCDNIKGQLTLDSVWPCQCGTAECEFGERCIAAQDSCEAPRKITGACTSGSDCQYGFCKGGYCCHGWQQGLSLGCTACFEDTSSDAGYCKTCDTGFDWKDTMSQQEDPNIWSPELFRCEATQAIGTNPGEITLGGTVSGITYRVVGAGLCADVNGEKLAFYMKTGMKHTECEIECTSSAPCLAFTWVPDDPTAPFNIDAVGTCYMFDGKFSPPEGWTAVNTGSGSSFVAYASYEVQGDCHKKEATCNWAVTTYGTAGTDGVGAGYTCKNSFSYSGHQFFSCTDFDDYRKWCKTTTSDADGRDWGYCNPCQDPLR